VDRGRAGRVAIQRVRSEAVKYTEVLRYQMKLPFEFTKFSRELEYAPEIFSIGVSNRKPFVAVRARGMIKEALYGKLRLIFKVPRQLS